MARTTPPASRLVRRFTLLRARRGCVYDPDQRYFEGALPPRPRRLVLARFSWAGAFKADAGGPWLPLKAEELFSCLEPGFVWSARLRMMGLVPVWVRESLMGRKAETRIRDDHMNRQAVREFLAATGTDDQDEAPRTAPTVNPLDLMRDTED